MITVKHNLDSKKFKWLWAKYVIGVNLNHHCTNSLKGLYSKKFSKLNPDFNSTETIVFDELEKFNAIYICGVSSHKYTIKQNYPFNLHLVLIPKPGAKTKYSFLDWNFDITNATVSEIITEGELSVEYKKLPPEYTTCRIFRWAASEGKKISTKP